MLPNASYTSATQIFGTLLSGRAVGTKNIPAHAHNKRCNIRTTV